MRGRVVRRERYQEPVIAQRFDADVVEGVVARDGAMRTRMRSRMTVNEASLVIERP